jgi:hypothetical protein
LLMDQDKLSNLYREPLIDESYQVSLYLAKRFQRRRFFLEINQSEHELSVAAMFVNGSGRNEQTLWRTSIDASYQVSVHLAKGFQRRLKCEKLTDDRRQTTDAKWWQKLTLPLARRAKKGQFSAISACGCR